MLNKFKVKFYYRNIKTLNKTTPKLKLRKNIEMLSTKRIRMRHKHSKSLKKTSSHPNTVKNLYSRRRRKKVYTPPFTA
jgi:hypothetical protein